MKGLLVEKADDGAVTATVKEIDEAQLPADGDVVVAIDYSTLNYKDGLCVTGSGGLVRTFPHVPGIDFAEISRQSGIDLENLCGEAIDRCVDEGFVERTDRRIRLTERGVLFADFVARELLG